MSSPPDALTRAEGKHSAEARARDAAALIRLQAYVVRRLAKIGPKVPTVMRARRLADLVVWLNRGDVALLLARVIAAPRFVRTRRVRRRSRGVEVPAWVLDEHSASYLDDARDFGEAEAAARARWRKREAMSSLGERLVDPDA